MSFSHGVSIKSAIPYNRWVEWLRLRLCMLAVDSSKPLLQLVMGEARPLRDVL